MSVEALEALKLLREKFSLAKDLEIPEGFKTIAEWGSAWDLGRDQTARLLNKGVQEKLVEGAVFKLHGRKVKYYKVNANN